IRRPASTYAADRFPDPVCQIIDDERREAHANDWRRAGGQFETSYYLVATYLPPGDAIARVAAFFVQGARTSGVTESRAWDGLLAKYRAALGALENRLATRLGFEPLSSD